MGWNFGGEDDKLRYDSKLDKLNNDTLRFKPFPLRRSCIKPHHLRRSSAILSTGIVGSDSNDSETETSQTTVIVDSDAARKLSKKNNRKKKIVFAVAAALLL